MTTHPTDAAIEAAREIDNLLSKVSGVNDERDSVPILLGIRERCQRYLLPFPAQPTLCIVPAKRNWKG